MDHLGHVTHLVGPHPGMEVSLLLSGQRRETDGVTELLGNGRDGVQLGEVGIAPGDVGHSVDLGRGSEGGRKTNPVLLNLPSPLLLPPSLLHAVSLPPQIPYLRTFNSVSVKRAPLCCFAAEGVGVADGRGV